YERAREGAAHRSRWQAALAELDAVAARCEERRRKIERAEREAAHLRDDLAQGASLAPLRQRLAAVEAQVERVGYDGARHEDVRRQLEKLAAAPQELARLATAQRDLAEGARRREAMADERATIETEADGHRRAVEAAAGVLAERPALMEA